MRDEIITRQQNDIIKAVNNVIADLALDEPVVEINAKTGTASVRGKLGDLQYTTTIQGCNNGYVKTNSVFDTSTRGDVLAEQIKQLRKQGHKQTEIAKMLNISQPTVSNYLNKH